MGRLELVCEIQGRRYPLEFQLLSRKVMGSQPPLLSGSDHCVKVGLIEVKASNSLVGPTARNCNDMMVCQLQPSVKVDRDTAAQELTSVVAGPPSDIFPVALNCGDEGEVRDSAAVVAEKKPALSSVSHASVAHLPVPWGKVTKAIILDVFKDVHTCLRCLKKNVWLLK